MEPFTPTPPDVLWKSIIEDLFEDFCRFFLPDLYPRLNLKKGYEFLDKELANLFPEEKGDRRFADRLVKVFLRNGEERWILIHVEIQGYEDREFSRRMFTYFYRIFDKYGREIVALAIFTDPNRRFKPQRFEYRFFGTELIYTYRVYKLLEQKQRSLMESDNPFAVVVLAGLYAIKYKGDDERRFRFKLKLIRLLMERGYSRESIWKLLIFIDGLLFLPEPLENQFREEVKKLVERRKRMGLTVEMSPFAYHFFQEGIQQGMREGLSQGQVRGLSEGICLALEIKFGDAALPLMEKMRRITMLEPLVQLKEMIKAASDIEVLQQYVDSL
ncbi:MAG: hypothetical protein D6681_14410, partial [Calditrichaeota bacterium]